MDSAADTPKGVGFPIRRSTDQRVLSPPRGLSQSATSFIAFTRQGIHQMPFSRLRARIPCAGTLPATEPLTHAKDHGQGPKTRLSAVSGQLSASKDAHRLPPASPSSPRPDTHARTPPPGTTGRQNPLHVSKIEQSAKRTRCQRSAVGTQRVWSRPGSNR